MKKIKNFLMDKPKWFIVPRWKIMAIIAREIVILIALFLIYPKVPLWAGWSILLLYLARGIYPLVSEIKKEKEMSKEDFAKHTKAILSMLFGGVCILASLAIIWVVLISPIIILVNFFPFLFESIPRQFLRFFSLVLAFLMFAPAGAINNLLWKRLMPEKEESEEAEKTKADKGGQ